MYGSRLGWLILFDEDNLDKQARHAGWTLFPNSHTYLLTYVCRIVGCWSTACQSVCKNYLMALYGTIACIRCIGEGKPLKS